MKKQFRDVHERMQEEQMKQQGFSQPASSQKAPSKSPGGDYIDFEEIK